jgi:hypothetical protein
MIQARGDVTDEKRCTRIAAHRLIHVPEDDTPALHALRVPLVRGLTGSRGTALGPSPSTSATLSVECRTARVGRIGRIGRVGRVTARVAATGPDSRTRECEGLDPVVDAHSSIRVVVLVGARELDHGPGAAIATVLDLDLHAREIVLRLANVRPMDTYSITCKSNRPDYRTSIFRGE